MCIRDSIETVHEGERWQDIKRFGIEISHNIENESPIVLKAHDLSLIHIYSRRMEAYFYFEIPEEHAICHFMGEVGETRHIWMKGCLLYTSRCV